MLRLLFLLVTVSGFCDQGQYNDSSKVGCQTCPSGYYTTTANNFAACVRCDPGTFQNVSGSSGCTECPIGFHQHSPAGTNCTKCDHFIIASTSLCVESCPTGSWNNVSTGKCDFCNAGQYLMGQTCQVCEVGYYKKEAGPSACSQCPVGYMSNVLDCHTCAVGQGMSSGECVDCVPGEYSLSGLCRSCAPGQFTSESNSLNCEKCEVGQFTGQVNSVQCTTCPVGKYASTSQQTQCLFCPLGYGTSEEGTSACLACSNGEQTVNGVCEACEAGLYLGDNQCITCPRGWASGQKADTCILCLDGTYTADSILPCIPCEQGQFPNINGTGSWKCCQEGECEDCPAGAYRAAAGCLDCPSGWVSQASGVCTQCDDTEGEYSETAGNQFCKDCSQGRSSDGRQCTDCTAGQFEVQFKCQDCPIGQYSTESANPSCTKCPLHNTTIGPGSTVITSCNVVCAANTIVDVFGDCQHCDLGQYANDQGECQFCSLGKFKNKVATDVCEDCPAGFTTKSTGNIDCFACPSGETCGCPWGQFGTKNNCQNCPTGYFSSGNLQCTICPLKTYQDEMGQGDCKECQAGQYGDITAAFRCKDCQAGQFQMTSGNMACENCPQGRYGSGVECTNCTAGTSTISTGSTTGTMCTDCPVGKMEHDHVCINCAEGLYQNNTGSSVCKNCPGSSWSSPGTPEASGCFGTKGLVTYTFGNIEDSKPSTPHTTSCELRPNFVMVCPGCTCDADARNGFWDGPLCGECRRGFATRFCTAICPGYDGQHDSTICNGNGRCWFGRQGNGQCYCGGKHNLDESSENVFVDVQYCPIGKICPGYGIEKVTATTYIPLYYLINYRQYTSFVLQMSKYTPKRGHMWFKRFSPSKAFENTCAVCNSKYLDSPLTSVGYWDRDNNYEMFPLAAQSLNGFHGENCQYECAVCLNGGACVHSPHPYRYSYTISNTFKAQRTAIYPTTTCLCSANVFDASHMCCPNGFQPYVYYGKRGTTPYTQFTTIPYVTSVDNNIDLGYYRDVDMMLEPGMGVEYLETSSFRVGDGPNIVTASFSAVGPYNKHVYHGTTKEICRACPGLFGKGVRAVDHLIETESEAESYWWNFPASAGAKKCQGQGVCDFYKKTREIDVDFMGDVNDYALLHRGRMCKSTSVGGFVNRTSLEQCVAYAKENVASFVAWAPDYYLGGVTSDIIGDYKTQILVEEAVTTEASYGWVRNTVDDPDSFRYAILADRLPKPNSDSLYEIHPVIAKRCIAFTSCTDLRPVEIPTYRAFNVYTVEKGRSDERLDSASFDRFDTCFTYTKDERQKFGLYLTQNYEQGDDPFLGGLCPPGYFCTQNELGTGFKEACPIGYYQPLEGQTRTDKNVHCSRNTNFQREGAEHVSSAPETMVNTITSSAKCSETLTKLGYANTATNVEHAPYGCYLQSDTENGTYTGGFNPNKEERIHVDTEQIITTECFSTHVGIWYKCVLDTTPCQSNVATKSSIDYVDNICQRCDRDSYASEGSYECTQCPPGRVKKISGEFDPFAIEIYNAPATQPWYYIANEGGTESDDCALVPPSVLHVPTGNDKMFESTTDEQYLPVLSCPFGYSSQPGTYIIDDIWQLRSILLKNQDIMVEPYISMEERLLGIESDVPCSCIAPTEDNVKYVIPETSEVCALLNARADDGDNVAVDGVWHGCLRFSASREAEYLDDVTKVHNYPSRDVKYICQRIVSGVSVLEQVVSTYCYPCPGDGMTGPASSMCSTCTANLIKKNMKNSLQKLVTNSESRMYKCLTNTCDVIQKEFNDTSLDIKYTKDIPAWYFLKKSDRTWPAQYVFAGITDPSLGGAAIELVLTDCILACATEFKTSYDMSNGVRPVRVGYARDPSKRQWCVCNEGTAPEDNSYGLVTMNTLCQEDIATYAECNAAATALRSTGLIPLDPYASPQTGSWTHMPSGCVLWSINEVHWNQHVHAAHKVDFTESRITSRICASVEKIDATGIATNTDKNSGDCKDLIAGDETRIKDVNCIQNTNAQILWYESTIMDDWDKDEFPLCGLCKPGTSYSGSKCADCEPGKFTSNFEESMMDSCKACPAGYFQNTQGRTGCRDCRPGMFQDLEGTSVCKDCPSGWSQNDFQKSECKGCVQGQYQEIKGQDSCFECKIGRFMAEEKSAKSCKGCPQGHFQSRGGKSVCDECPQGLYQDTTSQSMCKDCGQGQFQNEKGKTTCRLCPLGYVQDETGTDRCNPCSGNPSNADLFQHCSNSDCSWSNKQPQADVMKYQDVAGQLTCKACLAGQICTVDAGPRPCPDGHVMPAGVYSQGCYKCDNSTFALPEKNECKPCLAPSISTPTSCSPCSATTGGYPLPADCGGAIRCEQCEQCKMTEKVVNNACVPCPRATPIRNREDGRQCSVCETGQYWSGTEEGVCVDCPVEDAYLKNWKQLSTSCKDCGPHNWALHWWGEKKEYQSTSGTVTYPATGGLQYEAPWQGCCWGTDDYVKLRTYIVTDIWHAGRIIFSGDDYVQATLLNEDGDSIWSTKSTSGEVFVSTDRILQFEFTWANTDGYGNFKIDIKNAKAYLTKPIHTDVFHRCQPDGYAFHKQTNALSYNNRPWYGS